MLVCIFHFFHKLMKLGRQSLCLLVYLFQDTDGLSTLIYMFPLVQFFTMRDHVWISPLDHLEKGILNPLITILNKRQEENRDCKIPH